MRYGLFWLAAALALLPRPARALRDEDLGYSGPEKHRSLSRLDEWRSSLRGQIIGGRPVPPDMFDKYFNDKFFSENLDPFLEVEKMHKDMSGAFKDAGQSLFDSSWDNWFENRIKTKEFEPTVFLSEKAVLIFVNIPGLDRKTAAVKINDDFVKISFDAKTRRKDVEGKGAAETYSTRSYLKKLPLPYWAVPNTAKFSIERNTIVIKFIRRTANTGETEKTRYGRDFDEDRRFYEWP